MSMGIESDSSMLEETDDQSISSGYTLDPANSSGNSDIEPRNQTIYSELLELLIQFSGSLQMVILFWEDM